MPRRTGPVTADEFARLPDDDFCYELVAGVVHRMSPVGGLHGVVVVRLGAALVEWAEQHHAGAVMTETGFVLATNPDTVLAPDDRQTDVAARVRESLSHGVTLVWVIDPSARTVTVHRPVTPPEILTGDFILDGGSVLAGFEIPVSRISPEA